MSAETGWIESLPLQIPDNENCQKHKIKFDFSHIECIDNYLFLWRDSYSNKILRINLDTKDIQPIIIRENIKINSLKIMSRNNKHFLLISENKLKSQIHFINVNQPNKPFSYQSFSSHIIQIEYSSISSNTVFVLTNNNFNIIGLNDDCTQIIYHDRINVLGKHLINFCLGIPKHLHDKLFNEYNFYYGFSKFAAYFINKFGEIYVCSPIIPHKFQCSFQTLDALKLHFDADDEDALLYDIWLNQTWHFYHNLSDENEQYATYDATAQFIHENKTIYRDIYKLNIHQTAAHNNAQCVKIIMLDLDSFLFNQQLQKGNNSQYYDNNNNELEQDLLNVLPIFIRIYLDHSIDIVCCTKPIHCSFNSTECDKLYDSDISGDAIIICRNYVYIDDDDTNRELVEFYPSACVQILDELIIGHSFEGIYRLKMKWLNQIGFGLRDNKYFQLLQDCESNIYQIPLYKFYINSREDAYNAILSDLTVLNTRHSSNANNDELIILDEHLKQIHTLPLYHINMNKVLLNDEDDEKNKEAEIDIDTKVFDMKIMKPFETETIEGIKGSLAKVVFDINRFPADFALDSPSSLKWFVTNIKMVIEREVFDKLELGHLLMNERKHFIETQMQNYIEPQVSLIEDKIKQINTNNDKLKDKMCEIIENHKDLEKKIQILESKMKKYDRFYNNNENELIRFKSILKDYTKEVQVLEYDYGLLNQYKMANKKNHTQARWTKQDMLHLNGKIKNKLTNSDKMLKQIVEGLKQL